MEKNFVSLFFFEVGFFPPGDLLANFITVTEKLLQPHAE